MKLTVSEFVSNMELNDFKVLNIFLDIENKDFKLIMEGGYWFKDSISKPRIMEKGGIIRVSSYSSFEARYFLPKDKIWHTLDYQNLEMMDEINEKTYENSLLKLAGIGKKSGYWIEFLIKNGVFEITFED